MTSTILRELDELHKHFMSNTFSYIPGHVYLKNKDGLILGCNEEQAKFIGLKSSSEAIGKTIFDLIDNQEEAKRITEIDQRVIQTGDIHTIEEMYRSQWFLSKKVPLKNLNGEVIGLLGISLEVTKQKEQELSKSIATDNLLLHIPGHVYWKNKAGVFLGCNAEQAKYAGLKNPGDIVGKTNFDVGDKETAMRTIEIDNRVMETGETQIAEEKHGCRWFLSKKAPLKDFKGEIVGVFGLSLEITKQKIAEEALLKQNTDLLKALEIKERFLRNLSHEIRTPINGIFNILDGLEDEKIWNSTPDKEKRKLFRMFLDSRDRFMSLLSNMLDLSSLKSGKETFEMKYQDMQTIITEVVREFQNVASYVSLNIDSNVKTYIMCDEWRMAQVIRNVIANAIKFGGPDRPITIALDTHDENESTYLKISIKDEGVGIPNDQLEEIFDPFTESDRTKRMSGGTGIGLAICKNIIAAHRGRIWAENNLDGKGSTFFITLPYEEQPKKVYSYSLLRRS